MIQYIYWKRLNLYKLTKNMHGIAQASNGGMSPQKVAGEDDMRMTAIMDRLHRITRFLLQTVK